MYDNIYIDYKDSKIFIGYWSSFLVIPYLKWKIKKGEATAQNYAFLATAYSARCDYKNAMKFARQAIWYDKNYAYSYFIMGILLRENHGNYVKAEKYFKKALALAGKDYYLAIYELICAAANKSDNIERDKYETMYLNIDNDNAGYLFRKAYVYAGHWKYDLAYKAFFDAIKSSWKYKTQFDSNFFVLAIHLLVDSLISLPFRSVLRSDMAEYLISVGKEDEALEILFDLAKNDKRLSAWSYRYLADYYWEQEEYKKCYDITNRMLIIKKSAYAYYYKAISSWKLREYDDGLELLNKAEDLDKNQEFDNYDYWRCLMYCGLYDLNTALKYINLALLRQKNFDNYKIKGDILLEMNKIKEANFCYEEAEKLRN